MRGSTRKYWPSSGKTDKIVFILIILPLLLTACFDESPEDPSSGTGINKGPVLPVLETGIPSIQNENDIEVIGQITDLGKRPIIEYGHAWSAHDTPESLNMVTAFGPRNNTGSFISSIPVMDSEKTYYIRAYAITVVGTTFGELQSITID